MGKIFGISDNPVSTIESAIGMKPIKISSSVEHVVSFDKNNNVDKFISKEAKNKKSNPFIKMKNGFGKLMKHFSHKN